MATTTGERVLRLHVTPASVAALLVAVVGAVVVADVASAAHQAIGWFVAATIVALLLAPLVEVLERVMRRGLAIAVVLLVTAGFAGAVVYGVVNDVSSQLDRLQRAVPEAARELERDERFGEIARDFRLAERAEDAVENLGERFTGEAQATAYSVGAYFAGVILTIFLLTWSTRMMAGALSQVDDLERRARVRTYLFDTLHLWRYYMTATTAQMLTFGLAGFGLARAFGLPAPVPLALWVGLWAIVPFVGLLVGMLPMLLLAAGLESLEEAGLLLAVFVVLQVVQTFVQREVHRRSLYVGPAVVLVVGLVGYAIYAIGGALFGVAIAVFALALTDAVSTEELAPEVLDPTRRDDGATAPAP